MSALLIVRDDDGAIAGQPGDSARESLARQGFRAPRSRGFAGGTVHWYATPDNADRDELLQDIDDEGGFVACVGTLFYRGLGGGPALRELWHDLRGTDALGWDTLWGNYLLVVAKANRLWVFGDPVGTIRLYRTGDERVWSSSWLACADSASTRELDPIGTIDYVMSGANHGDRTPASRRADRRSGPGLRADREHVARARRTRRLDRGSRLLEHVAGGRRRGGDPRRSRRHDLAWFRPANPLGAIGRVRLAADRRGAALGRRYATCTCTARRATRTCASHRKPPARSVSQSSTSTRANSIARCPSRTKHISRGNAPSSTASR